MNTIFHTLFVQFDKRYELKELKKKYLMLIKAAFIDQKYSKTVQLCNIFTI